MLWMHGCIYGMLPCFCSQLLQKKPPTHSPLFALMFESSFALNKSDWMIAKPFIMNPPSNSEYNLTSFWCDLLKFGAITFTIGSLMYAHQLQHLSLCKRNKLLTTRPYNFFVQPCYTHTHTHTKKLPPCGAFQVIFGHFEHHKPNVTELFYWTESLITANHIKIWMEQDKNLF